MKSNYPALAANARRLSALLATLNDETMVLSGEENNDTLDNVESDRRRCALHRTAALAHLHALEAVHTAAEKREHYAQMLHHKEMYNLYYDVLKTR